MAAADRGSARHWLAARHVTGAGRAGGRGAGGGGAGAAAARRRLAGGAAEPLAARFSGPGEGGRRGGRERSAGGAAAWRAAAERPEAAAGCPARPLRPAPSEGADLLGTRPCAPGTPVATAAKGPEVPWRVPRTHAGGRAGGLVRRGLPGGQAAGPRARGSVSWRSHYVDRALQMRKLKHKEMKPLAEVARGEEAADSEPPHGEASLALGLGFISLAQRCLW